MRIVLTSIIFAALWLLWSGIYKPLLVTFGGFSIFVVVLILWKMNKVDSYRLHFPFKPLKLLAYLFWLLGEIIKANITVSKIILSPNMSIRQNLFSVPYSQKSDVAQTIFANSITLTPGTISVETENESFLVHALCYKPTDVDALSDMDKRITATEIRT